MANGPQTVKLPMVQLLGLRSYNSQAESYMRNGVVLKYGADNWFKQRNGFAGTGLDLHGVSFTTPVMSSIATWQNGDSYSMDPVYVMYDNQTGTPLTRAEVYVEGAGNFFHGTWNFAGSNKFSTGIAFPDGSHYFILAPGGAYLITYALGVGTYSGAALSTGLWGAPVSQFQPGVALLDDYLFVIDHDRNVFNCAVGDPTTWNLTDFIQLQSDSFQGTGIAKHMNYVIAFTRYTMTPLYDAGLPSPGSPLLPVQSAIFNVGCADGTSIRSDGDYLFWVGAGDGGGFGVYMLTPGSLVPQRVSTPVVDEFLLALNPSPPFQAVSAAAGISVLACTAFTHYGHVMYTVSQAAPVPGTLSAYPTFVFDATIGEWMIWDYAPAGGAFVGLPFHSSTRYNGVNRFVSKQNGAYYDLTGPVDSSMAASSSGVVQPTQNLFCEMQTGATPVGDYYRVDASRAVLWADLAQSALTAQLSYTDDDFQTYSSLRNLPLNSIRAEARDLGSSYRRAWRVSYINTGASSYMFRAKSLEVTLSGGSS